MFSILKKYIKTVKGLSVCLVQGKRIQKSRDIVHISTMLSAEMNSLLPNLLLTTKKT
jgi:hypothetical protein